MTQARSLERDYRLLNGGVDMADEFCEVRVVINQVEDAPPKMVVELPGQALCNDLSIRSQPSSMDGAFAHEGDQNAAAGYLAMWAGTLLLKDAMKVEPAADRDKKLNAKQHDCDCC
jgi:hypothetical protein